MWRRVACILLILACAAAGSVPAAAQEGKAKKVLILHSYHEGNEWTDSITAGVEAVLDAKDQNIEIYTEYMDASRIVEKGYSQKLYEFYRLKYGDIRFDAVIVADDEAFKFLLQRQRDLFPNTPCIFTGVNSYDPSLIPEGSACTGVMESPDFRGTLDAMLAIQPEAREVVVINDNTTTGAANRQLLDEVTPDYEDRVTFTYYEDMRMDEVTAAVATLPDDAVILLLTFNRDRAGTYYEYDESVELITGAARVPAYSVWDHYLGKGIVGGKLTEGFHQGRLAGEIALRVLAGEDIAAIPVTDGGQGRYIFDKTVMDRYAIDESTLPEGSTVINRPGGILVDTRIFWGTVIGILGLALTVVILGVNILRRRQAEEKLRKSEEKFRQLAVKQHEALEQIEQNLEDMAILNDHIRNPLTVIVALVDMDGGKIRDTVLAQAREIDLLINKLDKGWLESQKIREFLRRHYPVNGDETS
jgi:ABC-type uncharacterized transport system substrate-binding protein